MQTQLFKLALVGVVAIGLSACTTSGGSDSSTGGSVATAAKTSSARQQLTQAEVIATYTGKTARASDHSTTYNADGTWVASNGKTGRWSVTSSGILVMTGGLNLRLAIYKQGNRYIHRNVRSSGAGTAYSVG